MTDHKLICVENSIRVDKFIADSDLGISRSAAGFDSRKFDGATASVSMRVKNSTRRLATGSTPSTSATRPFSQFDVSR